MKKKTRKGLALLLTLALLACGLPAAAFADDPVTPPVINNDEDVLTAFSYNLGGSFGKAEGTISGKTIGLEVPYGYSGTMDFASGSISYSYGSDYSSAVPEFTGGSTIDIPEGSISVPATVSMTVTYKKTATADATGISTYTIEITKKAYRAPSYSGAVDVRGTCTDGYTFSASDFTTNYTAHDGGTSISKIVINGIGSNGISLQYNGEVCATGTEISLSGLSSLKAVAVDASIMSQYNAASSYSFDVYHLNPGTASEEVVEADVSMRISLVKSTSLEKINGAVNQTGVYSIPASEILSKFHGAVSSGEDMSGLSFTLPSSGKLYKGYKSAANPGTAVTAAASYKASDWNDLQYVPDADGRYSAATPVTIAYSVKDSYGLSYSGTLAVTVTPAEYLSKSVTYSAASGGVVTFKAADFYSALSSSKSKVLKSVSFILPTSATGSLHENYVSSSSTGTAVTEGTKYFYASKDGTVIDKVTFVPKTTGSITLRYVAYDGDGIAYNGKIIVTASGKADVKYSSVEQNETQTFSISDFNSAFNSATGGKTLKYIRIDTLPGSKEGTLYYNYTSSSGSGTAVRTSHSFYTKSSYGTPLISALTFVPYSSKTGTVSIPYTGYATDSTSCAGTITITVKASSTDLVTLSYSIDKGSYKTLSASDINTKFKAEAGKTLNYVKFDLPSTGTLYYNYKSSSSKGTEVKESTKYYYNSSDSDDPDLAKVTYVPKSTYTGTVSFEYTAYYNSSTYYTGKIKITVDTDTASGDIPTISYTVDNDEFVTFSASKFNTEFKDASGNDTLSYVKFTLPSSSYGTLKYKYKSSSSAGSAVSATSKYYRSVSSGSSNLELGEVSFVPKSGYTGTVSISYTGYDSDGDAFSGKVKITVEGSNADTLKSLTFALKSTETLRLPVSDMNTAYRTATGENCAYFKFTLPASGRLYYKYSSASKPGTAIAAGTKYYRNGTQPYASDITYVPASSYSGTVTINYTAYNEDGDEAKGTISITVSKVSGSKYFNDVGSNYEWAYAQIDYLYEKGVVKGDSSGRYNPSAKITRGDFMLMLYRAFSLNSTGSTTQFNDVSPSDYYAEALKIAKSLGIAKGSNNRFSPKSSLTRQDSMTLVQRTMEVKGKNLTSGSDTDLAKFSDKSSISSYAKSSVATLSRGGMVTGYSESGKTLFKPKNGLTRAEMAVILYRVMTK